MRFVIEEGKRTDTAELTAKLGLSLGDIKELNISPDGKIEIELEGAVASAFALKQADALWDRLVLALDNNFTAKQATILKKVFGRLFEKSLLP